MTSSSIFWRRSSAFVGFRLYVVAISDAAAGWDRGSAPARRCARPGRRPCTCRSWPAPPVPTTCETEYVLRRISRPVVDLEARTGRARAARSGGAVPLGVVLAAVARAAVAGRDDRHRARPGRSPCARARSACRGSAPVGPFACVGQPRWTQRFEMIVKLGTCSVGFWGSATGPLLRMKAVRRRDLALGRVDDERRDEPLAEREVRDRPEVDLVLLLAEETRQDREARHGHA